MQTKTLAEKIGIQPQALVRSLCVHGSYFGIVPTKMPNGRLIWPDDAIERLARIARQNTRPRKRAAEASSQPTVG